MEKTTSKKNTTHLSYHFTKREEELKAYYELRKLIYKEDLNLNDSVDTYDSNSYTMIIKMDGQVLGGLRFFVRYAESQVLLPLENYNFSLSDYFPNIDFRSSTCGEIGRIAIKREIRGLNVLRIGLEHLFTLAQSLGCQHQFSVAETKQAIYYRRIAQSMGFQIKSIPMKSEHLIGFSGIQMHLQHIDLRVDKHLC